jgi:sugar phosphate isomerase/epimerase
LLSGNQEEICGLAAELGIQTVIDPYVDPARWQAEADISKIASELNAAAKTAASYGLTVGYHNHHFELESKISGVHALEVFADRLAPEVVLEVDTYWAYAGGADVPALLKRLGDRVAALHLKDGDGTLDTSKQVAVGSGVLPVWDIIAAAPDALRVVELDDSQTDLLEAVRQSREFLLAEAAPA